MTVVLAGLIVGASTQTRAQSAALPECFGGRANGSAAAHLGTRLTLSDACEYSLSPDGGFQELTPNDRSTFLETLGTLGWTQRRLPVIYGRPRANGDAGGARENAVTPASSVILAHCTDFVLAPEGAFATRPRADAREIQVRRASDSCGAAAMALNFECSTSDATATLPWGRPEIDLPVCEGPWRVTASVGGRTSYALGTVSSGNPTALLAYFATEQSPREILVPDFSEGPRGFAFRRGSDATDALWAELQLAVAAGKFSIVRGSDASACDTAPPIPVAAFDDRLEIAGAAMGAYMVERYGEQGRGLVPGAEEWTTFLEQLQVCLPSSHGLHQPEVRSKPLAQLAPIAIVAASTPVTRICVDEPISRLEPQGVSEDARRERCMTSGDGATMITTAGATLPAVPEGLFLCHDERRVDPDESGVVLERGFYEFRVASGAGCSTGTGLSVGRVAVIDPGRDWVPSGLTRREGETGEEVPGWQGVRADDPLTFAFLRREDEFRFRIALPEGIATSWNDPRSGRETVLSDHAPLVGQETGTYGHAGESSFAVAITDSAECPVVEDAEESDVPPGTIARGELIESANDLRVDQRVHAHLLLRESGSSRCIARAALRVWPSRVVAHVRGSRRWHGRLGVLGDPRLGMFISNPNPIAFGLVLPLVHFDMHLPYGFDFEISVPFTAAIAKDGQASRISPAFMIGFDWGLPNRAQNLFTVGALIHAPWPHRLPDDQVYSFFIGLNLGGLYDVLGGR